MTTNAEPQQLLPYAQQALQWAIARGPWLLSILTILVAGWAAIVVARRATRHLIHLTNMDVHAERLGIPQRLYDLGFRGGIEALTDRLITLVGQLLLLHMVLERLGLHGLSQLALLAIAHLPQLAASAGIMGAGLFASDLVRRLLTRDGDKDNILPTGVYWLTLTISGAMALEQLGLDVSLIHTIILLIASAGSIAMALAAAVSARQTSRNLIARRYAITLLHIGDHIQTAATSGQVTAFHELHLALKPADEPDHQLLIPYHALLAQTMTILAEPEGGIHA